MEFFTENGIGEVKGLFSIDHLIFSLIGIIIIIILVSFSKNLSREKVKKIIKINFYIVLILEILKIIWNFTLRGTIDINNWVPLYFCSLYIYASFAFSYFKGKIKRYATLILVYGMPIAGFSFLLFPASSIGISSILQVLSVHSLIYHIILVYTGLILIINNYYEINKKDFLQYLILVIIIELFVFIFNLIFKSNLMYINNPGVVEPLLILYNFNKYLYPVIIGLLQPLITFGLSFFVYYLIIKIKRKKA